MDESHPAPLHEGRPTSQLDADIGAVLRDRLPAVAAQTVAAVTEEVPSYAGAFSGTMGDNIEAAVQMALGRLPQARLRQPRLRPEHAARPHAGGRLRPRSR